MQIIESGNIFESEAQTLVNTVNCVGVMGKGLALQFKRRYPHMFRVYEDLCHKQLFDIGKLWLYKTEHKWVLNFPTKYDWRQPSKEEYLEEGLQKFMQTYQLRGITSVAFPLLGASNGKIDPNRSLEIMRKYLDECNIPVSIYLSYNKEVPGLFEQETGI
ncbi:macro domain-containing protein [Pedobacter sp. HDW13]|uniref:macro domain-containing protein n=1 Tax=Pedobacter sp. HDW13 TaxID=2714940 RepID=UPI0014083945|nr:macro domain-containing protein [Pedobacter sp. HDW13]QIL42379.1 macro domain-containing protein [Pedobacter sp. HDW13]